MTTNEYGLTHGDGALIYAGISFLYALVLKIIWKFGDTTIQGLCGLLWPITLPFGLVMLAGWCLGGIAEWIVNIAEEIRDNWRRKMR